MVGKIGTYDSLRERNAQFSQIARILSDFGAQKIYAKKLAPNDNSKNQPYFGAHITELSFLPTGPAEATQTTSAKKKKDTVKFQFPLKLSWFDSTGRVYQAPNAKLIYYPQYPEVRFSGFALGSKVNVTRWMNPYKDGRAEGRWLIIGVSDDDHIYSYLVTPESKLAKECEDLTLSETASVLSVVELSGHSSTLTQKEQMLAKLLEIHQMGWVPSQRRDKDFKVIAYAAQNGGGYTLESLLGIKPNGIAEPDYLGWEVKQFGVKQFPAKGAGPTTLFTPEPDGGVYRDIGAADFVRAFGYPDKSGKPDRMNFGGKHVVGSVCSATNLELVINGFDSENGVISNANGDIRLVRSDEPEAASWSFAKLMDHWKKKHSQAVFIPSVRQSSTLHKYEYAFGSDVKLGEGTDFERILAALSSGAVYYDPGIKLEKVSDPKSKVKPRSQFRVAHKELSSLYYRFELLQLLTA